MSVSFGFAGLAFASFAFWKLFRGRCKNTFPCFTLFTMNEYCGVHNFDLQGIKKGTKTAIVINKNTEIFEDSIYFKGTGGLDEHQEINTRLNSCLANQKEPFLVFYRVEKNMYYLIGEAVRFGNYSAHIEDEKIVYMFPFRFLEGRLSRKIYLARAA